jgi:hypothetical protein
MPTRSLPVRAGAGDGRPALDLGEPQLKWRCRVVPPPIGARAGTSGAARQPSPAWRHSLRAAGTCPRPDRPPVGRAQSLRPHGCMDIRLHPLTTTRELPPGADPSGADPRRVQPRPCPRRVNHQDLVMTAHPPGGEARFVAKGSHGHKGAPGNTRRSEPPGEPGWVHLYE